MATDRNVPGMANRTLSRLMLTAFGVSLLAGAGQLGLAFGFGIVRLTGAFTGATANQWPAQLVWVGWFVMNAAVIGAVLTQQLARRDEQLTGTGRQVAIAGSAALGAMVVAPLCMRPARDAEIVSIDPVRVVAICAVLGAVIGTGAALAVLLRPPFAWNMAAVAGVMWLVALLSVVPSLGASGPLTPVRLGVLEPAWLDADTAQQLALLILPMLALLAGAATGALARQHGYPPLISGPSGAAGPLLVAFAYLAAGPGGVGDRYQLSPYYGALIAVAVGALGSAATALLPWPPASPVATGAIAPSAILPPLPATPTLPAPTDPRTSAETTTSPTTAADGPDEETTTSPAARPRPRTGSAASASTPTTAEPPRPAGWPPVLPLASGDALLDTTQQAEPLNSPPHWHWPNDRTTPRTPSAAPGTTLPGPSQADVVSPAAPTPAALISAGPTPATPTPASTSAGPGVDEGGSSPTGGCPARRALGRPVAGGRRQRHPGGGADHGPGGRPDQRHPDRRWHGRGHTGRGATTTPAPAPDARPGPSDHVEAHSRPAARSAARSQRARPPGRRRTAGPRPKGATPAETEQPATHQEKPRPAGTEPVAGSETPPAGVATDSGPPGGPARPDPAPDAAATRSAPVPRISTDPAAAIRDVSAAFTRPPAAGAKEAQPDGGGHRDKGGRRGLFRRGGSRSDATAAEREEPLAAQDEEYVHWVAGLSRPMDDDEPAPKKARRSLRPSGRHHRD